MLDLALDLSAEIAMGAQETVVILLSLFAVILAACASLLLVGAPKRTGRHGTVTIWDVVGALMAAAMVVVAVVAFTPVAIALWAVL